MKKQFQVWQSQPSFDVPNAHVIGIRGEGLSHLREGDTVTLELPEKPAAKTAGQKAYEAQGGQLRPWNDLQTNTRNFWHKIAAAVQGIEPLVEQEAMSPGERFFRAFQSCGAHQYAWLSIPNYDRAIWEARAKAHEASK